MKKVLKSKDFFFGWKSLSVLMFYFLLTNVSAFGSQNNSPFFVTPQSHSYCDCQLSGLVKDCCCEYSTVENLSSNLYPKLKKLLERNFFSHFRASLNRPCPFWQENLRCVQKGCAVEECPEEEIPESWREEISEVTRKLNFIPSYSECKYSDKDFCMVEDDDPEGVFVNLLHNPERFTGYDGPGANRIWGSIYNENCFKNGIMDAEGVCTEKRVFFRLISGIHSSIAAHLAAEYFDKQTEEWKFNLELFSDRLMKYHDRVENLYFTYLFVLRAVTKLSDYLPEYDYKTGNQTEDLITEELVNDIVFYAHSCPRTFDETVLFHGEHAQQLKDEFKERFRNISRIMDCVGCEKCRLWGKIQFMGLGTALKILYSYDSVKSVDLQLKRGEVIAIFNLLGKLSESLGFIQEYKERIREIKSHRLDEENRKQEL